MQETFYARVLERDVQSGARAAHAADFNALDHRKCGTEGNVD
jgi:hypothetical protein